MDVTAGFDGDHLYLQTDFVDSGNGCSSWPESGMPPCRKSVAAQGFFVFCRMRQTGLRKTGRIYASFSAPFGGLSRREIPMSGM